MVYGDMSLRRTKSRILTEQIKSSIKNPIGKGTLNKLDNLKGAWGSDKALTEEIFGKNYPIRLTVFTYDYNANGINDKQKEACEYYLKNKSKLYVGLENELLKYANSFLNSHEQPFQLKEQLRMLFIPDGIIIGESGDISMELENVFDIEHGIFVHMYPGRMYCTCDPALSPD